MFTNNTKFICSSKLLSNITKVRNKSNIRKASITSHLEKHENKLTYLSTSEEKTEELAISFAKILKSGLCLCLYGQIGSGKSVFR